MDKKIFNAVSRETLRAHFIAPHDPIPAGWFATREEAFANYKEPDHGMQRQEAPEEVVEEPVVKRRGRPRKE